MEYHFHFWFVKSYPLPIIEQITVGHDRDYVLVGILAVTGDVHIRHTQLFQVILYVTRCNSKYVYLLYVYLITIHVSKLLLNSMTLQFFY